MNEFRGQVAVITGASGGIGEAIAIQLAREGARLMLSGRSAEKLDLRGGAGARPHAGRRDLRRRSRRGRARCAPWRTARSRPIGGVDLLIHSIGLFLGGPFATSPVEDLDRQYRINVHAPYLLTQALLPSLVARQGQVVFVNSSSGSTPPAPAGSPTRPPSTPSAPWPTACATRSTSRGCG